MSITALAIDTSTEACSIGLLVGDQALVEYTEEPRKHTEMVLPSIDRLLTQAGISKSELDFISFARGPGSFTGLRIAASVVQALAFALDKPVVSVSTLQIIAQRCFREHKQASVHSAIDARMGEVYWGSYQLSEAGVMMPVSAENVLPPESIAEVYDLAKFDHNFAGAGSGWIYHDIFAKQCAVAASYPEIFPHAQDLLFCAVHFWNQGEQMAAKDVLPVYLRDDVAKKKGQA